MTTRAQTGQGRDGPAGPCAKGISRSVPGHHDMGLPVSRQFRFPGSVSRQTSGSFWVRAGQVCLLYLNPAPVTLLISLDEKTAMQARSRKHPGIPLQPGRDARREFEYVRHGTVSVIAAMNVTTGEVIAEQIARNDSVTFISFLSLLDQSIPPGLDIHLIMDNGSSHNSRATRAWLAAHPRITVTCTPKHASWLNMIEQWFGVLTRKLLRRGDFTSREVLETWITAFTIRHNKPARPYKWSYDADAEHARYLERHPQPEPQTALPKPHDSNAQSPRPSQELVVRGCTRWACRAWSAPPSPPAQPPYPASGWYAAHQADPGRWR
jgi:transposase